MGSLLIIPLSAKNHILLIQYNKIGAKETRIIGVA